MLIDLHVHLEGLVRPSTVAEFARQDGSGEPDIDWHDRLALAGPGDLTVFLAKVAAAYPAFNTPQRLHRLAREAVEDAARHGYDYLELRFGPATHRNRQQDLGAIIDAVCAGAAEGQRTTGLETGIVVAMLRHHDDDTNLAVARAAARHAGNGVVGFDLAGDELRYPDLSRYVDPFGIARAAGLGVTCHAAEAAPASAARDAVSLLRVRRIGHGAHIVDDSETLAWAAGEGITIEVCPTSNWFTGAIHAMADHPVAVFRDAGVQVVLGDDDPTQTGSFLDQERNVLQAELGFTATDLDRLDATSIDVAFAEEQTRARLRKRHASGRHVGLEGSDTGRIGEDM